MSFGVGITTLKLSMNPSSKASKQRTGKLAEILQEGLAERYSATPKQIDRSRSHLNSYEGYRRASDLIPAMMEEADIESYLRKLNGGKALRSDASIGFAVIVKPEADEINSWDPDKRARFFRDSDAILDTILDPKNLRAKVMHRDEEADHQHRYYMGYDEHGNINVDAIINPRLWNRLNVEYVEKMRELGWDIEDHDLYDAQRAQDDPDYAKERNTRRNRFGRSTELYGAQKDIEKQQAELDRREAELHAREERLNTAEKEQAEAIRLGRTAQAERLKNQEISEEQNIRSKRQGLDISDIHW